MDNFYKSQSGQAAGAKFHGPSIKCKISEDSLLKLKEILSPDVSPLYPIYEIN